MQGQQANNKILGSIAYPHSPRPYPAARLVFITTIDGFEVADTVGYIKPGSDTTIRPFGLLNGQSSTNLIARNLTASSTATSTFASQWETSAISQGSSVGSVGNVFSSSSGARICKRYKDGVLTNEPLWPWPMNQRIINAMVESGRAAVDVTNTIESMLGPVPANCTSIPTASIPTAPVHLQVGP